MSPGGTADGALFRTRADAGRRLAERLAGRWPGEEPLVLALPRGGVAVGFEIAAALGADLDVVIVRKLGVPWQPELAMGAIASGGVEVLNPEVVGLTGVERADLERVAEVERRELERRERAYRGERPPPDVRGRTVVLVDDGIATGATIRAAARSLRSRGVARLVVAVPVAPADTIARLEDLADEVVCLATPEPFVAIGPWYEEFPQMTDEEVRTLLDEAARLHDATAE